MDESEFNLNIAIAGLGLIGGSYAKALKNLRPKKIYGIDMNEEVLRKALDMGIIDEGYREGSRVLPKADITIIALYPEDTIKFVRENINFFKPYSVITDTCGVKQMIVEEINSFLPQNLDFIGAHPMAGKESSGLQNASSDIFEGCNFIITPYGRNNEENVILIEKMAKAIGCGSVVKIAPIEHDKMIALTSNLTHAVAVSLMNLADLNTNMFIGGSFRDATRVADINSKLWTQLFTLNSDNLVREIDEFEKMLASIKEALVTNDKKILEGLFETAGQKRREIAI